MKISKTHQKFANTLRNQRALDNPVEFLGPNWKDVLNFWFFLDTLTEEQWNSINSSLSSDERQLARRASCVAARAVAASDAAWDAAFFAANYVAGSYAAGYATDELIGSHILQEQNKSLVFLPMVLNV